MWDRQDPRRLSHRCFTDGTECGNLYPRDEMTLFARRNLPGGESYKVLMRSCYEASGSEPLTTTQHNGPLTDELTATWAPVAVTLSYAVQTFNASGTSEPSSTLTASTPASAEGFIPEGELVAARQRSTGTELIEYASDPPDGTITTYGLIAGSRVRGALHSRRDSDSFLMPGAKRQCDLPNKRSRLSPRPDDTAATMEIDQENHRPDGTIIAADSENWTSFAAKLFRVNSGLPICTQSVEGDHKPTTQRILTP